MKINQLLVDLLRERNLKISTAESVTGGKIISSLIEISGASNITEQSYVVYSNQAKRAVLGVDTKVIEGFGVVSEEVALEMARGLKKVANCDIAIATTGEAGPNPSDSEIQIGTVCFSLIIKEEEYTYKKIFAGDRLGIIDNATVFILSELFYKLK